MHNIQSKKIARRVQIFMFNYNKSNNLPTQVAKPQPKTYSTGSVSLRSTTPFPLTQWAEATHCFPIKWTGNLRIKPAATKVKK